tara:strand:+ start:2392 stop:3201 length:810 start_codon:yes stop_codon:yes gene_type:complete
MVENGPESSFSFVVPTEFVDIPSGGKLYPPDHPLHQKECIEIRQMTAKEEDILTSRSLLKKGVAIDRLIRSVIVDKAVDPGTLLVGDRNALIVATRVSGYGPTYETKVTCPSCGDLKPYTFDLNEATVKGPMVPTRDEAEASYDIENNGDGTFDVTLPQTKLVVTVHVLNGYDEKRVAGLLESDRKRKAERNISRQLSTLMVAVNGNDTSEAINYVATNLPSGDSMYLRNAYKYIAPNIDLTQAFGCSSCGYEQDMEVPLNAEFFWPNA